MMTPPKLKEIDWKNPESLQPFDLETKTTNGFKYDTQGYSLLSGIVEYYTEPWPRLPRKTKKLINSSERTDKKTGFYLHNRKEHKRDRKRWAHYLDRHVRTNRKCIQRVS